MSKQVVVDEQIVSRPAVNAPSQPITREGTDAAFEGASNILDVYGAMNQRCEEFRNDEDSRGRETRKAGAMTPDQDVLWQGDVGVILMSDTAFKRVKGDLKPMGNGASHVQVAVGEGVGSRHTVSTTEVRVFSRSSSTPLDGPVVVADKAWTLSHPKHQNVQFEPGNYAICYQRQFAEEMRRAAD